MNSLLSVFQRRVHSPPHNLLVVTPDGSMPAAWADQPCIEEPTMIIHPSSPSDSMSNSPTASNTRSLIVRGACSAVLAGVTLLMALSFAGCRTTEGAGRDVEALGDNIADSANENTP
jgi:predicted small secreted protein